MSRSLSITLAWAIGLGGAFLPASAQEPLPEGDFAIVCHIEDEINDGIAVVVERAVREAENAKLLIFVIDTPGGRVDSAINITQSILKASCPTAAYIKGMGAMSAGAIISYACDHIIMAPATQIGASAPVMMGAEPSEVMNQKSVSFVRAIYRSLAEEKGHNALIGEAMVDGDLEIYAVRNDDDTVTVFLVEDGETVEESGSAIHPEMGELVDQVFDSSEGAEDSPIKKVLEKFMGGTQKPGADDLDEEAVAPKKRGRPADLPEGAVRISARGELLTLTTQESVRWGLAMSSQKSIEDTMEFLDFGEMAIVTIEPTWAEALFAFLTNPMISGLLVMCAMGGIYLEVRTPGFGLPGIIGVTCLAIFFGAHYVIGLADWLDLTLVLLGLLLIVIELFALPGFGLAGLAGVLSLLTGLYLSLTRVAIPQFDWDFDRLGNAGQTITVASLLFIALNMLLWKLFPKTPLFKWLILEEAQTVEAGYTVQTTAQEQSAVGLTGVTTSMLRPSGRGRFGAKTYDIVTRGEFLEAGAPVRIIQAEGNRHVVTALEEDSA